MVVLREIIERVDARVDAAKACAAARVDAAKACAVARVHAAKACAAERTLAARSRVEAVKACAKERFRAGLREAECRFELTGRRVQIWFIENRQARADKRALDDFNRDMHKFDQLIAKRDYKVRVQEYYQWRLDQSEITCRDLYKRMQQQGMIRPDVPFPIPLREGLYDKKPSPLPPKKPLIQSYSEHLKKSHEVAGLFKGTLFLVVRPVRHVVVFIGAMTLVGAGYEEIKKPGSLRKRFNSLASAVGKGSVGDVKEGGLSDGDAKS